MYNKTVWESELGTGLNRFKDNISGNTLELTRQPTSITRAGTVFSVNAMNNIENGIEALEQKTLLEDTITSSNLTGLGQTPMAWYGMTSLGTDVYACVEGGDIYKQTNGTGDFLPLNQTSRRWTGMTILGNDVYASVEDGDIYKQTNGTGDFLPLGQTSRFWRAMTTLGHDIYACVLSGDIYKQTNGTGDFLPLGQTIRPWRGITTLGNDVYACVFNGDIYKQANGSGNFVALGQTPRGWLGMTSLGNDVYASDYAGDIYKQTNGTGNFVALGQTSRQWRGMTTLGNDIYACVFSGDIYKADATKFGLILDTPLRTYNLNSTSSMSIYPTASLGEPKTFRKISSDTNVITITLPSGNTFSGGGQSITLTNQWEEVTIERVSSSVWRLLSSATGGVDNGAVIERGSNANGEWVKFADGTLINHHSFLAGGYGLLGEKTHQWVFPMQVVTGGTTASFSVLEGGTQTGRSILRGGFSSFFRTNATIIVDVTTAYTSAPLVSFTAIGRWK